MNEESTFVEMARRRFSLADFRRFAGDGVRNHHTDAAQARRIGLPAPLAPGAMVASWLWTALAARWGGGSLSGVRIAVTFLAPAWADDEVRLLIDDRDAATAACAMRVEDEGGRLVAAATAERIQPIPEESPS